MLPPRLATAAAAAAALACASGAPTPPPPPLAADVVGGDAGRTFQSPTLGGPRPATLDKNVAQAFNWSVPREDPSSPGPTRWRFYEGAMDADGDLYYFGFGAGGYLPPIVYKVSGADGTQLWRTPLPAPYWQDGTTGNDHFLLTPHGLAVVVPGTSWYNTPFEGYVAGVRTDDGSVAWLVNTTLPPQSVRLLGGGATAVVHWWNNSLSLLDTATGEFGPTWDLSADNELANVTTWRLTIAEGVPKKKAEAEAQQQEEQPPLASGPPKPSPTSAPVALFTTAGRAVAVELGRGRVLWAGGDPTGATAFGPVWGAGHVAGSATALWATLGNYLDVAGAAGVDVLTGDVAWGYNWTSTFVSVARYPTRQGTAWVSLSDSSSYAQDRLLAAANGSAIGQAYMPRPGAGGLTFSSPFATSADGVCQYQVTQGSRCSSCSDDVYLLGVCALAPSPSASPVPTRSPTPTASPSASAGAAAAAGGSDVAAAAASAVGGSPATYSVVLFQMINELCHPDVRKVALGPRDGQLTVWHTRGLAVYEAVDGPAPPGPAYSELCR